MLSVRMLATGSWYTNALLVAEKVHAPSWLHRASSRRSCTLLCVVNTMKQDAHVRRRYRSQGAAASAVAGKPSILNYHYTGLGLSTYYGTVSMVLYTSQHGTHPN